MKSNNRIIHLVLILNIVIGICTLLATNSEATTTHTVKFITNGGTPVEDQIVEDGEHAVEPSTSRDGWIGKYWYKDESLNDFFSFTRDVITEDITLYAGWYKNLYIYTSGNGKVGPDGLGPIYEDPVGTYVLDGKTNNIYAEPNEGYIFLGWKKDGNPEIFSTDNPFEVEPIYGEEVSFTAVFEEDSEFEKYELYVNGIQFNSNKTSITCGDGTATFDPSNNTLTLDNATIDTVYGYQFGVINSGLPNLTINLVGDNILEGYNNNDGIDADASCNITITGSGTLTMQNIYYGTYIGSWGNPGGDLTINNTTVNIPSAVCAGIWVNHDIIFENSNVQVTKNNDSYNGIVSNVDGTITLNGGEVTVNTVKAAIHFGNTDDSNHSLIVNSGTLKLISTENDGIHVEPVSGTEEINGTIIINGGVLDVTSATKGTNVPEEKITIGSGLGYVVGESLSDSGNVVIKTTTTEVATGIVTIEKNTLISSALTNENFPGLESGNSIKIINSKRK